MLNFWRIGLLCLLALVNLSFSSRVLELSDRFLDVRSEGLWFVMFYAPWCGHCKKLEPIWNHVAQALYNSNVRVGRIDCTRFTAVAKAFQISGFPTLMFIKGPHEYIYNGDRSKEELLHFVMRMSGPPVQQVTRIDSFEVLKNNNPVFFTYVGKQDGQLWETYYSVAEIFQAHSYFYATSTEIADRHFEIDSTPAVLVYKEKIHYYFPLSDNYDNVELTHLNKSLNQWINEERFLTFPKITRFNFHQLSQTKKYLVLVVVEENKLSEIATHELEFRDMMEEFIHRNRFKYHSKFQFGWVGTPDLAHSIAMETLATPHVIVVNTTTNEHHIPDDEPLQLTPEAMDLFLESVTNHSAPAYGGNAYHVRVYRALFEGRQALVDMWQGNPVLTTVLFGLPFGFFALILYSICCADIMDADEEDDEQDLHQKKE